MLAHVYCASTYGVDAHLIDVETHAVNGLPKYFLVGLPDRAISESRDRIEAAISNSGLEMPRGRITVNLAPANLPKEGSSFDLSIAVGLLAMSRQISHDKLAYTLILGELALDGSLRPVKGILPMTLEAKERGLRQVVIPKVNAREAAVVEGIDIYGFSNLAEVVQWLSGYRDLKPARVKVNELFRVERSGVMPDFCDVKGQENVKRAMEVAAAGGHNIIML
ncbi:MAG: magnesium chelatase domain-containing protein [Balneolales bacterium]